jgi:hypothetical protein
VDTDVVQVKRFEISIAHLMKGNHDGHDFAQTQRARAFSTTFLRGQHLLRPLIFKILAKVIYLAKQLF